MTRIWFISDTHNAHDQLRLPPGVDVVVHCGDESSSGKLSQNEDECRRFLSWYSALEIPVKIFVPGNHSIAVEQNLIRAQDYPAIKFLIHEPCRFGQILFFGSPFTPQYSDWAYMKTRQELTTLWQSIPSGIDILITHGPPKGILDVTRDADHGKPIHAGSRSLADQIMQRIRPRLHAFGHIHDEQEIDNFGSVFRQGIHFLNCACCDLHQRLKHHGWVMDWPPTVAEHFRSGHPDYLNQTPMSGLSHPTREFSSCAWSIFPGLS